MNTHLGTESIENRARKRVGMKLGFYTHALVYVLVNLGLFALAQAGGSGRWNVWPLAGWGLGLAIHGVVTFIALRSDGLRERMMAGEIARLRQRP